MQHLINILLTCSVLHYANHRQRTDRVLNIIRTKGMIRNISQTVDFDYDIIDVSTGWLSCGWPEV